MTFVAHHDEVIALAVQFCNFHMHLGDQRAGGIKDAKATDLRLMLDRLGHAMRAEDQRCALGHFVQRLDEDGPTLTQIFHHVCVVHDLVSHIDRCTKFLQGMFDDVDGAIHTRTKTSRFGQQHLLHSGRRHHSTPITSTSKVTGCPARG